MKLSNLNGAIRAVDGPVLVKITMADGRPLVVGLQKSSLLAGLKEAFDGARTAETGFTVVDGTLVIEHPHGVHPNGTPKDGFEDGDEELLGDPDGEIDLFADEDDLDLLA